MWGKSLQLPASPDSWQTRSNMDSWGRFYTRPFLPVKGEDAVNIVSIYIHLFNHQQSTNVTAVGCMFICKCRRKLSHLLHLLVLPHTSVSHEKVRVILLTERDLLHCGFIQLGDQLRCKQQPQYLTCSHSSVITSLHARVNVCVYSRRCISLYSIVRACSELSSVGSRVATSWAKLNASSCFPVLWRPIAFRTWEEEKRWQWRQHRQMRRMRRRRQQRKMKN